ncbi:hypothetical protein D3C71_1856180 [compost metagenome]
MPGGAGVVQFPVFPFQSLPQHNGCMDAQLSGVLNHFDDRPDRLAPVFARHDMKLLDAHSGHQGYRLPGIALRYGVPVQFTVPDRHSAE